MFKPDIKFPYIYNYPSSRYVCLKNKGVIYCKESKCLPTCIIQCSARADFFIQLNVIVPNGVKFKKKSFLRNQLKWNHRFTQWCKGKKLQGFSNKLDFRKTFNMCERIITERVFSMIILKVLKVWSVVMF